MRNLPSCSITAATTTMCSAMMLVLGIVRVRGAERRHRADEALRFSRGAQGSAEIHQRLIEIKCARSRHEGRGHRPEFLLRRVCFRRALAYEHTKQHSRHIGVEDRSALTKREAADSSGCVRADTFER